MLPGSPSAFLHKSQDVCISEPLDPLLNGSTGRVEGERVDGCAPKGTGRETTVAIKKLMGIEREGMVNRHAHSVPDHYR